MRKIFFIIIFSTIFSFEISAQTANAGNDQILCTNFTQTEANIPPDGYTGYWEIINGVCNIQNATLYNTDVTQIENGDVILKWNITNGVSTSSDDVIISNKTATSAQLESTKKLCQNYTSLTANPPFNEEYGYWTKISGAGIIQTQSYYITNVTNLSEGENIYRWTISNSFCSNFDEISVINNQVYATAGNDQELCVNQATIDAVVPSRGIGSWTITSSVGTPYIENTLSNITNVYDLGAGINSFAWTVVLDDCSAVDYIYISNNEPTISDAGIDKSVCDPNSFLSGNNPAIGIGTWTVTFGNATVVYLNNYNSDVINLSDGINTFKWTIDNNGCISESSVDIFYDYFTAYAGEDDSVCSSSYTLNADIPQKGYGVWSVTGGNGVFVDQSLHNTVVNELNNSYNTFAWTVKHGVCSKTDYVVIKNMLGSQAITASDKEVCQNTTSITAINPTIGIGFWTKLQGTGIIENSLSPFTFVYNLSKDINKFRWTVNNEQCSSFDEIIVVNNEVFTQVDDDQVICGSSTTISALKPEKYEYGIWSEIVGNGIIDNESSFITQVSNLSVGDNIFRWTIHKGICSVSDDVLIVNKKYQASASLAEGDKICIDNTAIMGNEPPPGTLGYWEMIFGGGYFDNSLSTTTYARNLDVGVNTMTWTIEKDGCSDKDTISVTRYNIYADAGQDISICDYSTILTANEIPIEVTGNWTKVFGYGNIQTPYSNTTIVTDIYPGTSTFRWSVSGFGCSDYDDVTVINNVFLISAGVNQHNCTNYTYLNGGSPGEGYGVWSVVVGNGIFENPSLRNTFVSGIDDIGFSVFRWTVYRNGCSDSDDVTIYNDGVTAIAEQDFSLCTDNTEICATDPAPATGYWAVYNGGGAILNPNSPTTTVTGLAQGLNFFLWTVDYGSCSSEDDLVVYNNSFTSSAGLDKETCYDYIQMTADQPGENAYGVWEIVLGYGEFEDISLSNTFVMNLERGVNTFKWTVYKNGCNSGGDEVNVWNKNFDAYAGEDQILPQNVTSTTMAADLPIGASGSWQLTAGGGVILNPTEPDTDISGMPTGVNSFKWTVTENSCVSSDFVNIIVADFNIYAGEDITSCFDTVVANADDLAADSKLWTIIQGYGEFIDETDPKTEIINIAGGVNIFRWTVTINGASLSDDFIVTRIFAYAGEDKGVNQNFTTLEANNPADLNATGSWSLVSGNGNIENINSYITLVQNLQEGNSIFRWTIEHDLCPTPLSDDVVILYDPTLSIKKQNESEDVNIYPIPAKDVLFFSSEKDKINSITIFDINGRIINKYASFKDNGEINLKYLSNGIYFVLFNTNNNESILKKFIVEK